MRGAIPPFPQYVFMAWCLVKHRDNFTFTMSRSSSGLSPPGFLVNILYVLFVSFIHATCPVHLTLIMCTFLCEKLFQFPSNWCNFHECIFDVNRFVRVSSSYVTVASCEKVRCGWIIIWTALWSLQTSISFHVRVKVNKITILWPIAEGWKAPNQNLRLLPMNGENLGDESYCLFVLVFAFQQFWRVLIKFSLDCKCDIPIMRYFSNRIYEGYPKVSGLAAWSENCKCYSSLPIGAVISLFCESV
jgi:hypothetical protein